jgi:outer membrane murein-binding lipoprotein Lpp
MGVLKISTVSLAVLFILGCSSGQSADPPGVATPPPTKTVFDPLTQDLKKARDVQQAADANADNTRQAVDHQERGDSTP